jgi:hypothetical protein
MDRIRVCTRARTMHTHIWESSRVSLGAGRAEGPDDERATMSDRGAIIDVDL